MNLTKSWKTPTPEQVDLAIARLSRLEHRRYFFDRLENPEWIIPLKSKGCFSHPPAPQSDTERNVTTFFVWPESRYLARIASLRPETVTQVILDLPDTDNPLVLADLVQAALNMPPGLAATLVEKAKKWTLCPNEGTLPQKIGRLVVHFAGGGEVQAALDLAGILFEVLPDPHRRSATFPHPRARYDAATYKMILKDTLPHVVTSAGIRAFTLVSNLLESAVRLSQRSGEGEGVEDYSFIWRPLIQGEKSRSLDEKDVLVSGVLDAAEQIAQSDTNKVSELVRLMEDRGWRVFHRITLVLLREFHNAAPELVAERLMERRLFDDADRSPEYAFLAMECFEKLTDEQKNLLLGWIEEGPDLEAYGDAREQWEGKQPSADEITTYKEKWRRDRLSWLLRGLPQKSREYYAALVAKHGEPNSPVRERRRGGFVGWTSPKGTDELQTLSVSEIVKFLKTWKPSAEMTAPSAEGLSRNLSSVVTQDPGRFAAEATSFVGLDPTYVSGLLSGFRDAVKSKKAFEWSSVLQLCLWVVKEPIEIPGRLSQTWDADPDWSWARHTISDLLCAGFDQEEPGIPYEYHSTVWAVLQPLTNDPEPTAAADDTQIDSATDAATRAINTTRGAAMHAVVRYALWVHRFLDKLPDGKDRLSRGFEEIQEVREVLESHLDVSLDPSLAIRSLYGQWFPWLVLLDPAWAEDHVKDVFPDDGSATAFRDAAWVAYITQCEPYDNVFRVLHDQYALSVERLETRQKEISRAAESLAGHLMTFYWRGKLSLDEPNGLISRFWIKAADSVRAHAVAYIGESLCHTDETVSPEILHRLIVYWERRVAAAKEAPDICRAEMAAFGHWFVSGKFDQLWAIRQLSVALKIAGEIHPDNMVVERLAALAVTMPEEAVSCLEAIVRGDKEGWSIYGWSDHARAILVTACQSNNRKAVAAAADLIHYMGSRGYLDFRDLLPNPQQ